jgi:hypothetical protein
VLSICPASGWRGRVGEKELNCVRWFVSVILATQEAEGKRTEIRGRPALAKSSLDAISVDKKLGTVVHSAIPAKQKAHIRGWRFRLAQAQTPEPIWKMPQVKRVVGHGSRCTVIA